MGLEISGLEQERVIVPNHRTPLALGTLGSIMKQARITRDIVRREM